MTRTIARLGLGALLLLPLAAQAQEEFSENFRLKDCRFLATGENPYFIRLQPGRQLVFEDDETTLFITVLDQTRRITLPIGGRLRTVRAAVVEEREYVDGELEEISRNFFALCERTNDVFYFGEDVDIYENGQLVSHDGAWLAGRNGARPGIVMPGTVLLGSRYAQEVAPGVAQDREEHVAEGLDIETDAGSFHDCVEVTETTPLEPGSEGTKQYCPGVGLVSDNDLPLVEINNGVDEEDD
jgi:hypothetical protein